MHLIIMLLILTALELNTFQKKLKTLLVTKIYEQIFLECKHIIQFCFGFIDFML